MSDDLTTAYLLGAEQMRDKLHKQADEIERLRAENETLRRDVKTAVMGDSAELQDVKRENEKLRELIRNVSRGVQSYRPDINMAGVWLPTIQQIHEYLRQLDEAAALKEFGE